MRTHFIAVSILAAMFFPNLTTAQGNLDKLIDAEMPGLLSTYKYLHEHPELSHFEERTASFVAAELRSIGYEVTERTGSYGNPQYISYGIVALLKNGKGPTLLLRTDLERADPLQILRLEKNLIARSLIKLL